MQEQPPTQPQASQTAQEKENQSVAERIEDISAVDAAEVLRGMSIERAADVAKYLDPQTAAKIISEMPADLAAELVSQMGRADGSLLLAEMDPDDRVDVLEHIETEAHDELVKNLSSDDQDEVRRLEQYASDTAGGVMTTHVTALYEYISVGDAVETLRKLHDELEQMFYVYVIDKRGALVGVLSMRDMILSRPAMILRDIMIKGVRSVPVTMDQEEVAKFMRKYRYLAVPVVGQGNILLGLITADDMADVIIDEATEDVQKMFGAGAEERLNSPWQLSFRQRVWWLVVNLGTAFVAAAIVGLFEGTIQKIAILAAYMPVVAGMGGNASAQAMAVTVRRLSMGTVDKKLLYHVIKREFFVGFLSGIVIAVITSTIAIAYHSAMEHDPKDIYVSPWMLGVVVGLALIINHTIATVSGAGIPFIMKKLGFDPAQSATIFATTVTDVVGFFALLGLAAILLL